MKAAVISTISDFPGYANLSRWSTKGEYACPGIRQELHPKKNPRNNNLSFPKACYEMTREEKDTFLETLKSIKPPDEYSSNISYCVQLKERKLMGMKSYDCHMLMQEYLPIALRGTLGLLNHIVETLFTRPIRNDDDGGDNQNEIEESNFLRPGRPLGKHARSDLSYLKRKRIPNYEIDDHSLKQAHRYVTRLEEQRDPRVTEEIKWLARGPNNHVVVSVVDVNPQKGNTRPIVVNYYGSLKDIIELNYSGKVRVILFKCDWVDASRGCKKDEFGVTLVNFSYALEGWLVVRHVKVKDTFNMRCDNDDNSPASSSCTLDIPNLDRVGVDADEVVDGTLVIEFVEEVDKDEVD
ncbi:hypothetical protein Tco_1047117 [Tanacetum coccineum]